MQLVTAVLLATAGALVSGVACTQLDDDTLADSSYATRAKPSGDGGAAEGGSGGLPDPVSIPPRSINGLQLTEATRAKLADFAQVVAREVPDLQLHAVDLALAGWWGLVHGVPADSEKARGFDQCTLADTTIVPVPGLGACEGTQWLVGMSATDPRAFFGDEVTSGLTRVHPEADEGTVLRRALADAAVAPESRVYAHVTARPSALRARYLLRDVALGAVLQGESVRSLCLEVPDERNPCLQPTSTDRTVAALASSHDALVNAVRAIADLILAQPSSVPAAPLQKTPTPAPTVGCEGREDGSYCGWALGDRLAAESVQTCAAGVTTVTRTCDGGDTCETNAAGAVGCRSDTFF